jgi:putative endonuclease
MVASNTRPTLNVTEPLTKALLPTWWLYLLACADGRTYTGITLDVEARFRNHINGKGAKFTRANPPLTILGAQAFADKSSAMQAEYALKQLAKADKLLWAQHWPYRPAS